MVMVSPLSGWATCRAHSSSPSAASRATRYPSAVPQDDVAVLDGHATVVLPQSLVPGLPHVAPALPAGGCVERHGHAGRREIQDPVVLDGAGVEGLRDPHLVGAHDAQPAHVGRRDLGERRVPGPGVCSPCDTASRRCPGERAPPGSVPCPGAGPLPGDERRRRCRGRARGGGQRRQVDGVEAGFRAVERLGAGRHAVARQHVGEHVDVGRVGERPGRRLGHGRAQHLEQMPGALVAPIVEEASSRERGAHGSLELGPVAVGAVGPVHAPPRRGLPGRVRGLGMHGEGEARPDAESREDHERVTGVGHADRAFFGG